MYHFPYIKACSVLSVLFWAVTVCGQTKDRRREITPLSPYTSMTVSPQGKIWINNGGTTYYAKNIDSNLHYDDELSEITDDTAHYSPIASNISFFNEDTAILPINTPNNEGRCYRTINGGRTWERIDYGSTDRLSATYIDRLGNVWLGGENGNLYYSSSYGQTMETMLLPYKKSDKTISIVMSNSKNGYAFGNNNEILTTNDNWKTTRNIPSPFDQLKQEKEYEKEKWNDLNGITFCANNLIVKQDRTFFYTAENEILWKPLPININMYMYSVDNMSKKLFGYTDSGYIVSFDSPTEYKKVDVNLPPFSPIDFKVVNNALYILSHWFIIYKSDSLEIRHKHLYTTDKPIMTPDIIVKGNNLYWGNTKQQLFIADDSTLDWYRVQFLDFELTDISLLDDSTAILKTPHNRNYEYSLKDNTLKVYYPTNPIGSFLSAPVKSVEIFAEEEGCFNYSHTSVNYLRSSESLLKTKKAFTNVQYNPTTKAFKNTINSFRLESILNEINSRPAKVPKLSDFRITRQDTKNYVAYLDSAGWGIWANWEHSRQYRRDTLLYQSVPSMLDRISESDFDSILNRGEGIESTQSAKFVVKIINQQNDTLTISRDFFIESLPWHLPLKVSYKGVSFNSYNLELSHFIKSCVPDYFLYYYYFDNKMLLMEIANYLYAKKTGELYFIDK